MLEHARDRLGIEYYAVSQPTLDQARNRAAAAAVAG
jgi:hypothetical protein